MNENLVGYLLESLDPDSRREVDDYLRDHPEAHEQMELLRKALEPLSADADPIEPPAGLWIRTLSRVAEHTCRPAPSAPQITISADRPVVTSRWRRSDLLVAAGLFLCVGLLIPPGVIVLRDRQDRINCQDNLRILHGGLVDYTETNNGAYPMVPERGTVAETLIPVLRRVSTRDDGAFPCPANQRLPAGRQASTAAGCYAYSLGYRDGQGLHGHRRGDDDNLPLMADRPWVRDDDDVRDNSLNHGGQNILYLGGHVRFSKHRAAGVDGDDIYHNRIGKVAAGVDSKDSVLGTNEDQP